MRNTVKRIAVGLLCAVSLAACSTESDSSQTEVKDFEPRLDTERTVELNFGSFMGNYEALDRVENDFNEYYPNVTLVRDKTSGPMLAEYLKNNPQNDIFMVDYTNVRNDKQPERYVADYCVDLSQEDIDFSAVNKKMISAGTFNDKLLTVPVGETRYGMCVNKTLLAKEGIEVPTNYSEFMDACARLKEKGYTPILGSNSSVYANLVKSMTMCEIAENEDLIALLDADDSRAAEYFRPIYEKIRYIVDNGYVDYDVNEEYCGTDNYDRAILHFFEGEVPFWVCSTESVSGMAKRESKSEAFTNNPFDYEFVYIPVGDDGAYEYIEPWYGFSVNKNAPNYEYAVEFIRFLTTEKEINQIADIKGIPSAANEQNIEKYAKMSEADNIRHSLINDNVVDHYYCTYYVCDTCTDFGAGKHSTVDELVKATADKIEKVKVEEEEYAKNN